MDGSGSTAGRLRRRWVSRAKPSASATLLNAERRLARLPDASRRIVGIGADLDLRPVDEALGLADNVGEARIIDRIALIIVRTTGIIVGLGGNNVSMAGIIVRTGRINVRTAGTIVGTDGYVVGTRGIEVSERGNKGTDRGNDAGKGEDDLTEVGNDVYTAGDVVGEEVSDGSAPDRQPDGGANRCRGS